MNSNTFERNNELVFIAKLVLLALLVRFCIGTAYYNIFIAALNMPLYAFDGEAYSIAGWYIALALKGVNIFMLPAALNPNDFAVIGGLFGAIETYHGALPPINNYGIGVYSYIIGFFYYIFGYAPILLRLFMGIISILTALLAYGMARRIFDERVGRISLLIVLFMPSLVLYSVSFQRDTLVNFLVLLVASRVLLFWSVRSRPERLFDIAVSIAGLALLYNIRINSMKVLVLFMVILVVLKCAMSYRRLAMIAASLVIMINPLFNKVLGALKPQIINMLNYHVGLNFSGGATFRILPDRYYAYLMTTGQAPSNTYSVWDIFTGWLAGLKCLLLEPSPFSLNKIGQAIVVPDMIIWYFIVAFSLYGIYRCFRSISTDKALLMILLIIFSSAIGLSEANFEALIRHRGMIVPVFIIFAAYGITEIGRLKNNKEVA